MTEQRYRARNLGRIIEEQGRTKRWVASQAGFSEGMLSHVIAGRKTIGEGAATEVAKALGVPFFLLFESASADVVAAQSNALQEQPA